jgi:hypothetical protein
MQDLGGNRPKEKPAKDSVAVSRHEDEIGFQLASMFSDCFGRIPATEKPLDGDVFQFSLTELLQEFLAPAQMFGSVNFVRRDPKTQRPV